MTDKPVYNTTDIERLAREFQRENPTFNVKECWIRAELWLEERKKRSRPQSIDQPIEYFPKIEERP